MSIMQKVIEEIKSTTVSKVVYLSMSSYHHGTVHSSKLYGRPFFPQGAQYPLKKKGVPMLFFGQLNFSQLPKLEGFPEKGILQFFISEPDDEFGTNHGHTADNTLFRVIYHENNDATHENPRFWVPTHSEFEITGHLAEEAMSFDDFRFNKTLFPLYEKYAEKKSDMLCDLSNEEIGEIYPLIVEHNRIGGYCTLTSGDPRGYLDSPYTEHTVTLFQIVSGESNEVLWLNNSSLGFFIRPEDLKKRDFSNVLLVIS